MNFLFCFIKVLKNIVCASMKKETIFFGTSMFGSYDDSTLSKKSRLSDLDFLKFASGWFRYNWMWMIKLSTYHLREDPSNDKC